MSLYQLLEERKDIDIHMKLSILLDIILGLQYLHGLNPPIIHRDLTSKNVLLTSDMIAKIADLGVSRIFNPDPSMSFQYLTACPGNLSHMPPEALTGAQFYKQSAENVEKFDIFSFGNVMLHVLTREFPIPLPAFDDVTLSPRSEVERRQCYLKMIDNLHIKKLIVSCLHNSPLKRPSTIEVVQMLIKQVSMLRLEVRKHIENEQSNSVKMQSMAPIQIQPSNPRVSSLGHDSVTLTWDMPATTAVIKFFNVYCFHGNDQKKMLMKHQTKDDVPKITIDTLSPNTTYSFKVTAMYESDYCESEPVTTGNLVCSPPGKPNVISITKDSITVQWNHPDLYYKEVECYKVCCHTEGGLSIQQIVPANKNTVQVSQLLPDTEYTFQVTASCLSGSCMKGKQSDPIMTQSESVSSAPGKPIATSTSHNEITLTWSKPQKGSDLVTHYRVTVHSNIGTESDVYTKSDATTTTITSLLPNTDYIFTVTACCHSGTSHCSESSEHIATKPAICSKPGKPTVVECTHNSMTVKWKSPFVGGDLVKKYHVTLSADKSDTTVKLTTESTTATAGTLAPNTTYYVKVTAECELGFSQESDQSDPIITDDTVCSAPGKPTSLSVSEDFIVVKWVHPQKKRESVKCYEVFCFAMENAPSPWEKAAVCDSCTTKQKITGLFPGTKYIFKVLARCECDTVVASEVSYPYTTLGNKVPTCSAPGQPKAVSVSHNEIILKWPKPSNGSQFVTCYRITVYCGNIRGDMVFTEDDTTTFVFKNLVPNTNYVFTVAACSNSKVSKESIESANVLTEAISSKPGKPTAVDVTHNSIKVTWEKPSIGSNCVTKYNVTCSNKASQSLRFATTSNTAVAKNLTPNTVYCFTVVAVCPSGLSDESEQSKPITTKHSTCSAPGKPCCSNVTEDSITILWTHPYINVDVVRSYEVHYHEEAWADWQVVSSIGDNWLLATTCDATSNSAKVSNLQSGTKYTFKVIAVCKSDCTVESKESNPITTLSKAICSSPGKPMATCISHDKVVLKWSKPKDCHDLKQYRITIYGDGCEDSTFLTKDDINTATVPGLVSMSNYYFSVSAYNPHGYSAESPKSVKIVTLAKVCSKPGKPSIVKVSHNSVTVDWSSPSTGADMVQKYHVTFTSNKGLVHSVVTTNNTATTDNLNPCTVYHIKVVGECSLGFSDESEESEFMTTAADVCSAPGKPAAISINANFITIKWSCPRKNAQFVVGYNILYCSGTPSNWCHYGACSATTNKFKVDKLLPSTRYV